MHNIAHTGCGRQWSIYVRQGGELYSRPQPESGSSQSSSASACSSSCCLVFFIPTSATGYHQFRRAYQYGDEHDNIGDDDDDDECHIYIFSNERWYSHIDDDDDFECIWVVLCINKQNILNEDDLFDFVD